MILVALVAYGRKELTEQAIASWREVYYPGRWRFEIHDNTEHNIGLGAGLDAVFTAGKERRDYYVTACNDVIVPPNVLTALKAAMDDNPDIAALGCQCQGAGHPDEIVPIHFEDANGHPVCFGRKIGVPPVMIRGSVYREFGPIVREGQKPTPVGDLYRWWDRIPERWRLGALGSVMSTHLGCGPEYREKNAEYVQWIQGRRTTPLEATDAR